MDSFKYKIAKPFLDYYSIETIEIKPNQFDVLIIERRYGPSWWLLGYKYNKEQEKWDESQIEEIYVDDIAKLIKWCNEYSIRFTARPLTNDLDIIRPCYEIYKCYLDFMNKEINEHSKIR